MADDNGRIQGMVAPSPRVIVSLNAKCMLIAAQCREREGAPDVP